MKVDDEKVQWYAALTTSGTLVNDLAVDLIAARAEVGVLEILLREARFTIEKLAEQQAMGDDWYVNVLQKIDVELSKIIERRITA